MIKDYISNLVNQKIPMPNSWQVNIGLEVQSSKQIEFDEKAISERTGYTFLDDLSRGYISHKPKAYSYSGDTHYLLGMYLRALKELKGLDYLPFYNCVTRVETKHLRQISYAPVMRGKVYSIFYDSMFPAIIDVRYSHTGASLLPAKKSISKPSDSAYNVKIDFDIDENLVEYVELVIETNKNIDVAVIEGEYHSYPSCLIFDSGLTSRVQGVIQGDGSTKTLSKLFPKIGKTKENWSPKLIQCLLGISVSDTSDIEIKRDLLATFTGSTVEDAVKNNIRGFYDVNGYSDKRLTW